MSIFEKIAIFLLRLLGVWGVILGVQSLLWFVVNHFGLWSKPEYSSGWGIAGAAYLVGGVLLIALSERIGKLVAKGLQ